MSEEASKVFDLQGQRMLLNELMDALPDGGLVRCSMEDSPDFVRGFADFMVAHYGVAAQMLMRRLEDGSFEFHYLFCTIQLKPSQDVPKHEIRFGDKRAVNFCGVINRSAELSYTGDLI